ncbi:hypothetical protein [Aestuariibacter salexigens]|uniref:hypothetical protein n=1 Tax=Aestuariibacter salexigens TaxID=226010 RepID=UPI000424CB1D|nr:hypothetical protein [Aestuariibacter salexigens]
MREKIRLTLFRLGSHPQKSWAHFKVGLIVFFVGALCIQFSPQFIEYLYHAGIAIVLAGFAIAMYGYVGIFANRFSRFIERRPRPPKF